MVPPGAPSLLKNSALRGTFIDLCSAGAATLIPPGVRTRRCEPPDLDRAKPDAPDAARAKHYYHDRRFATLAEVVDQFLKSI